MPFPLGRDMDVTISLSTMAAIALCISSFLGELFSWEIAEEAASCYRDPQAGYLPAIGSSLWFSKPHTGMTVSSNPQSEDHRTIIVTVWDEI